MARLVVRKVEAFLALIVLVFIGWVGCQQVSKSTFNRKFLGTWELQTRFFARTTEPNLVIRPDHTYTFEHRTHSWHQSGEEITLEQFYDLNDAVLQLRGDKTLTDNIPDGKSFSKK